MSRNIVSDTSDVTVERLRPEDVAAADELWLSTVDKAIEGEKGTHRALQEHVSEIDETLSTLKTLHEKIHYNVMIPFGRVAMFKGQMVRTNEVHVHLSSSVMVNTSNKHAQAILRRRRDYTLEKQELVQQQIDALESRRVFADSEKEQDGEKIEEIVEAYDEKVHGPLDGPMVRDEVYASRKYYGPPRNEAERLAHEADMEALKNFVAQHAEDPSPAADAQQDIQGRSAPEALSPRSTDSDDEDPAALPPQPVPAAIASTQLQATPLAGEPQLEQELDRLVAAFEGTADMDDGSHGRTEDLTAQAAKPLIQEIARQAPQESTRTTPATTAQASTSSAASRTGLKHGFFNKAAKPTKGILKKVSKPAEAEQPTQSSGLHVSSALAKKETRTAAELSAFSGVVKERSQAAATAHISNDQPKEQDCSTATPGVRRVSKFKSQRAAAAGNTQPPA